MDVVVIGCGLSGMVIARELAEKGKKVLILEKRNHIGGNIFDETNEDGFLIQKYGPHCFFTHNKWIRDYIQRYTQVEDCFVECKTVIDHKRIPMPFNFESIDIIYPPETANELKNRLINQFGEDNIVSVTDLLDSSDTMIKEYGMYMYENEYKLYTSKQWDRDIDSISPSVFKRVPVYISNFKYYQSHEYQFLPKGGFTELAKSILKHPNITVKLNRNPLEENKVVFLDGKMHIKCDGEEFCGPIVYTGALDELFSLKYGRLPYRSLEFVWKSINQEAYQDTAIVAYPQADKITRITEYKKLPLQQLQGKTIISIEIPFEYDPLSPVGSEPYYPIINDENASLYEKYLNEKEKYDNLFICGRLADYRYYNMDAVIEKSISVAEHISKRYTL